MAQLSLKQVAYNKIKNKILNCEYEPNSFLNEETLCTDLDMSRTPIRDALSRLEQEHLIQIIPKKGFFISSLSMNEINMVYEGRLVIEPYVIRNYCQHLNDDVLSLMREHLKKEQEALSSDSFLDINADDSFHNCIISQCTNRYFLHLYEELNAQNTRIRVLGGKFSSDRALLTYQEHSSIFSSLSCNEAEQAAQAMEQHLKKSREAFFHSFISSNIPL